MIRFDVTGECLKEAMTGVNGSAGLSQSQKLVYSDWSKLRNIAGSYADDKLMVFCGMTGELKVSYLGDELFSVCGEDYFVDALKRELKAMAIVNAANKKLNINNIKREKENDNMNKGMFKGFDFGVVSGEAGIRISHLGLAIKNKENTYVSFDKNQEALVDVDFLDMDLDGMIYKMPVSHKDVKGGDVVIHNGTPMIVKNVADSTIKVIDPVAGELKEVMPTKNMFGFNFFTKIVSLIDMSGANANEDNPFGNLMPLMFMNKGNGDNSKMMMAMMMMQQNKSDMMSNPMMMMAMMGGDKMNDMLPMMMMMGGSNPFTPQGGSNEDK